MIQKPTDSRFTGRTQAIVLQRLERETQRILAIGFGVSILAHLLTAIFFIVSSPEKPVPKPVYR